MQRLILFFTLTFLFMQVHGQEEQPSDKHFWYSLETTASPAEIWAIWMDVPNWKQWDTGLKDARTASPLQLGTTGTITTLDDRKARFKVIAFVPGESYTYKTKLPLGGLVVKRSLRSEGDQTIFTHEVWFTGLTKGLFAKAFGGTFREMLPNVLANIKQIAERD